MINSLMSFLIGYFDYQECKFDLNIAVIIKSHRDQTVKCIMQRQEMHKADWRQLHKFLN